MCQDFASIPHHGLHTNTIFSYFLKSKQDFFLYGHFLFFYFYLKWGEVANAKPLLLEASENSNWRLRKIILGWGVGVTKPPLGITCSPQIACCLSPLYQGLDKIVLNLVLFPSPYV